MSYTKFLIFTCTAYLFYFAGCFIWDTFFSKSPKNNSSENEIINVDFENYPEPSIVEEEDYLFDKKKKPINMTIPAVTYDKVEHQGIPVTALFRQEVKKETAQYMQAIRGLA